MGLAPCALLAPSVNVTAEMLGSWIRALVFVTVAVLIGNAQCFANCVSSLCSQNLCSQKTHSKKSVPSNSCHHHDGDTVGCSHQHSELAAPETGLARFGFDSGAPFLPSPATNLAAFKIHSQFLSHCFIGSPPGNRFG